MRTADKFRRMFDHFLAALACAGAGEAEYWCLLNVFARFRDHSKAKRLTVGRLLEGALAARRTRTNNSHINSWSFLV